MSAVIILFTTLSAVILFVFLGFSMSRFGFLPSYSSYLQKWSEAVPMNSTNLWSTVTTVSAGLLMPAFVELAGLSLWHLAGLAIPFYMFAVALCPMCKGGKIQKIIRPIFSFIGVNLSIIWCVFIAARPFSFFVVMAFILALALFSGKAKSSALLWFEIAIFITTYVMVFQLIPAIYL